METSLSDVEHMYEHAKKVTEKRILGYNAGGKHLTHAQIARMYMILFAECFAFAAEKENKNEEH